MMKPRKASSETSRSALGAQAGLTTGSGLISSLTAGEVTLVAMVVGPLERAVYLFPAWTATLFRRGPGASPSRSTDLRLVGFLAGLAAEEVEIAPLVGLQDVVEKHGVVAPPEASRSGPPASEPLLKFFVRDHEVQAA